MKTYTIKYKYSVLSTAGNPGFYYLPLSEKTEIVETQNIKKEVEKIQKQCENMRWPGVFPSQKGCFELVEVKSI